MINRHYKSRRRQRGFFTALATGLKFATAAKSVFDAFRGPRGGGGGYPAPPKEEMDHIKKNVLANSEQMQKVFGKMGKLLEEMIGENSKYQDELKDIYKKSHERLAKREDYDQIMEGLGKSGELKTIERLVNIGGAEDQQRAAQHARSSFDAEYGRMQTEREHNEAIYGTADRTGRDNLAAKALARSKADYDAREGARLAGDQLRFGNLGVLQQYGNAMENNLGAQRSAVEGQRLAEQNKYGVPMGAASDYGALGQRASNLWGDTWKATTGMWHANTAHARGANEVAGANAYGAGMGAAHGGAGGILGGGGFGSVIPPKPGAVWGQEGSHPTINTGLGGVFGNLGVFGRKAGNFGAGMNALGNLIGTYTGQNPFGYNPAGYAADNKFGAI